MRSSAPLNPAYPSDYPGWKRSNPRKKWCYIGIPVAVVVLILIIVISVVATRNNHKGDDNVPVGSQAVKAVCDTSRYPDVCNSTLQGYPNANPKELAVYIVQALEQALNESLNSVNTTLLTSNLDPNVSKALEVCYEVLNEAYDQLDVSIQKLNSLTDPTTVNQQLQDLNTWLSASATFHDTCLDELVLAVNFDYPPADITNIQQPTDLVTAQGEHIRELYSIALSFVAYLTQYSSQLPSLPSFPKIGRRLLDVEDPWVGRKMHLRRLLQVISTQQPNVTVGPSGSGASVTTIKEALDGAPDSSDTLYIIKLLAGTYQGQVSIGKKQKNIALVGSGIDLTILTEHQSVNGTGTTTFRSATLAIGGENFFGTGFTVQNTAGPQNHQAVALRSSADKAVFYQVKATGYQDTLYTHSFRQYYRSCQITGTVDFMFGNGAAYFQDCTFLATTGLLGQQNTFTAQGRTDPGQATGLVFQNCNFGPDPALKANAASYLTYFGRPWKNYSRTVLLENNIDAILAPAGWLPWIGNLYLDTLFYVEYKSRGTGSNTSGRVKWPGVHQYTQSSDVQQFLLDPFLSGASWIPSYVGSYDNFKT